MSAGVLAGVSSDPVEHVDPVGVPRVILVHQAHLAEVDGLDPDVDVAAGQEIEPHPRLQPAHVRDRATAPPVVHEPPVGVEHVRIPEIAVLDGQTELDEDVLRDGDGFHPSGHDLERGGLQDDLGVGLVKRIGVGPRRLEKGGEFLLPPPDHERPPHELGPRREDQPHVVAGIDAPAVTRLSQIVVEKFGERDRPIEIILQHWSRHRRIESKILSQRRRRPEKNGQEKTNGPEAGGGIRALVDHDVARLPMEKQGLAHSV